MYIINKTLLLKRKFLISGMSKYIFFPPPPWVNIRHQVSRVCLLVLCRFCLDASCIRDCRSGKPPSTCGTLTGHRWRQPWTRGCNEHSDRKWNYTWTRSHKAGGGTRPPPGPGCPLRRCWMSRRSKGRYQPHSSAQSRPGQWERELERIDQSEANFTWAQSCHVATLVWNRRTSWQVVKNIN